uniref:Vacuolar ATP synthase subunit F n=1 Tax=Arundo donax TaxID=35708 RepID=A0A0A9FU02_ARUDO
MKLPALYCRKRGMRLCCCVVCSIYLYLKLHVSLGCGAREA